MQLRTVTALLVPALVCLVSCVSAPRAPGSEVTTELQRRASISRSVGQPDTLVLPAGVSVADGLTEDEAVALALTNNPEYQARIAELGTSQAEVLRARLLPNPLLSTVLGSSWEATLVAPIDALLRRPGRIHVAEHTYDAQLQQVVQGGLDLMLTTRLAFADTLLAQRQLEIATGAAERAEHVRRITTSSAQAGNASGLEARTTRSQAATTAQAAITRRTARTTAENHLRRLTRLSDSTWDGKLVPTTLLPPSDIDVAFLEQFAFAHRPDLEAAELTLQAAAARIGIARSEALTLAAGAKLTGDGAARDTRPALNLTLPILNTGQADLLAARAQAEKAAFLYVGTREQIRQQVRDATLELEQATATARTWRENIVPELEVAVDRSQRAYAAGDVSYLAVLDSQQRLFDAQQAEAEADAAVGRATATLIRHVGGSMPSHSVGKIDP